MLSEIEAIKQEKAQGEEEILGLMELQERLAAESRDAESRLKAREEQARQDEASCARSSRRSRPELAGLRADRDSRARELPRPLLADYEKILKARSGVAVASVTSSAVCSGCRVSIRPQGHPGAEGRAGADALRELRPVPLLAGPRLTARPRRRRTSAQLKIPRARLGRPGPSPTVAVRRAQNRQKSPVYTDGACSGQPRAWEAGPRSSSTATRERVAPRRARPHHQSADGAPGRRRGALAAVPGRRRIHVYSTAPTIVNCFRERWWERWGAERAGETARSSLVANRDSLGAPAQGVIRN